MGEVDIEPQASTGIRFGRLPHSGDAQAAPRAGRRMSLESSISVAYSFAFMGLCWFSVEVGVFVASGTGWNW